MNNAGLLPWKASNRWFDGVPGVGFASICKANFNIADLNPDCVATFGDSCKDTCNQEREDNGNLPVSIQEAAPVFAHLRKCRFEMHPKVRNVNGDLRQQPQDQEEPLRNKIWPPAPRRGLKRLPRDEIVARATSRPLENQ